MRSSSTLDKRAAELGDVVRGIVKRFEGANLAAANGPHADLTMQETRVVELLGEGGGQMMRAVAVYLGVAVNSVTTLADNLERKGLLRRVRCDADRRVVHVELTEAGQRASRSVIDIKNRFHREMLAALTDEEQAILLVLLRKIGGLQSAHVHSGAPLVQSMDDVSSRPKSKSKDSSTRRNSRRGKTNSK